MTAKYKRRNFFVNKQLQGKMMFQVYVLIAVGGVVFSALLFYFTSDSLTIVYQNNDLQVGKTSLIFFNDFIKANWIILIPVGLLVVLGVLFQSHHTAGPLYKFEMVLDNMIAGNVGKEVWLRNKDNGQKLAKKLTVFNQKIASTLLDLQELNKQLEDCASEQELPILQQRVKELSLEIKTTLETYTIEE